MECLSISGLLWLLERLLSIPRHLAEVRFHASVHTLQPLHAGGCGDEKNTARKLKELLDAEG